MNQEMNEILKKVTNKNKFDLGDMKLQSFFVSSTFRDMQGERDALHQIVLPRMREKAAEYGNRVQFIDLRWGISTQDMDSDDGAAKIMEVCLDEIESCKPYMIILLGERYGWMPSVDLIEDALKKKNVPIDCYPMSITEMEIQYGMLLNSGYLNRCVFCMRKPLPLEKMSDDCVQNMVCSSAEEQQRLEKLKEHIRQTEGANILEYELDWDEKSQRLTGYDAFAEELSEYLEKLLVREWGKTQNMSWQKKQYQEDMMLKETLNSCFIGRENQVKKSLQKLKDTQVYIMEAEGGSGKSAFISEMARRLEEDQVKTHMIYCGNSSSCTSVEQLVEIIGWRLGFFAGMNKLEEGHFERHRSFYNQQIAKYDGPDTVVFIDAIDQLYRDDALFQSWYMPQELPDNLKFVITTTGTVQVNPQALSGMNCVKEELTPPDEMEIREIIRGMFQAEHKQISEQNVEELLKNPCSRNMLALSMMVRRLTMLGSKDFKTIHELEKTMDGDAAIRTYLSKVIAGFSQKTEKLVDAYIWDVSNFLMEGDEGWSNMLILYLIASTENGMSREDFEQLTDFIRHDPDLSAHEAWCTFWNELKFARMRRFLGPFLVQKSDGKMDFTHRLIREGLRTNHAVKYCAIILLRYFMDGSTDPDTKYDSGLPLCRQLIDKDLEDKEPIDVSVQNYLSGLICEVGNKYNSEKPERGKLGETQMEMLRKSVLMDISCENGHKHLDTYCEAIQRLIQNGAGPQQWVIWFFNQQIAQSLWNQSDDGRTMAIQIYLAILSAFMKPEKKQIRENFSQWESKALCRFFFYTRRLERLLTSSIAHKRIYGKDYDYSWSRLTEDGIAWFESHLKKFPDKRSVLGNYSAFVIDQADIYSDTFGSKKYFKLAEDVLLRMKDDLGLEEDFDDYRIYIRRLSELALTYQKKHWSGLTSGKKYLERAKELSEEAIQLYEQLPEAKKNIRLEIIVYRNRAQILPAMDETSAAVKMLWQVFEHIYPKADTLSDAFRNTFSGMNMLLLEYLFRFRKVYANGNDKYTMAKTILQYEMGYVRANVNVNFGSRYHWARILQIRAYCKWYEGSNDYENDLAEARSWLEELAQEQKKNSKGIDGWRYNAENALKYDLSSEVRPE